MKEVITMKTWKQLGLLQSIAKISLFINKNAFMNDFCGSRVDNAW